MSANFLLTTEFGCIMIGFVEFISCKFNRRSMVRIPLADIIWLHNVGLH